MTAPWVGLSLMLEEDVRHAAAPLFAQEAVDVLEWSFDTGWPRRMPAWADALLDHYAGAGRLLGHGVEYSPLSATWEERQTRWLASLEREVARRRYVHVSEHYGFMTTPPFRRGAPLPTPQSRAAVETARDRFARLRDVTHTPVGIENLALSFTADDARAQGALLERMLPANDDFLVLDVHNLFCAMQNFGLAADESLASFPASRVREIHVSGGSVLPAWWNLPAAGTVRCDTHDGDVPEAVFELVDRALARFPNVVAVIFERLGGSLRSEEEAERFRRDYLRLREIATKPRSHETAPPVPALGALLEDDAASLARLQLALLEALHEGASESEIRARLAASEGLDAYREHLASADGRALGIAARVTKKHARR